MNLDYVYATFLMRNDSYMPGALLLGYMLKNQTAHSTLCLVTEAVSLAARHALELIFDYVVDIDEYKLKSHKTQGRKDRDSLLTRFNVLRLGSDGDLPIHCKQIILLDADVYPLTGFDELFSVPATAGILLEGKESYLEYDEYGKLIRRTDENGEWLWHRNYNPVCPHGGKIPRYITDRVKTQHGNMGVNSALWRIEPSMEEYGRFTRLLEEPCINQLVTRDFPWPEMQLATLMWSGRWTNIDMRYCSIGGYPDIRVLKGIHFAGLKPWQISNRSILHYASYPDFRLWYDSYMTMYFSNPALGKISMLKRIFEFIKGL